MNRIKGEAGCSGRRPKTNTPILNLPWPSQHIRGARCLRVFLHAVPGTFTFFGPATFCHGFADYTLGKKAEKEKTCFVKYGTMDPHRHEPPSHDFLMKCIFHWDCVLGMNLH